MRGYIFDADSEKPFVCKECKKAFTSEGAFNLHGPCGPGYRKGKGQKGSSARKEVGCSCGGNVRLLSSLNELEYRAMKAGAVSVCVKCGNLFK